VRPAAACPAAAAGSADAATAWRHTVSESSTLSASRRQSFRFPTARCARGWVSRRSPQQLVAAGIGGALRGQAGDGPLTGFGGEGEAVVEAVLAALPELHALGHEAVASPEIGERDFIGETGFEFG